MTAEEQILTAILNCRLEDLRRESARLSPQQKLLYDRLLARYKDGEPLQYVIGFTEFCNVRIYVNKHVLIPRPETEILTDYLIQRIMAMPPESKPRVLDLGTGSGNIAVALAKACSDLQVTAVDVSPMALELARQNAIENEVSGQVRFVCEDMAVFCKTFGDVYGAYDIIVSNPPYIRTEDLGSLPRDVQREPRLALDGGPDGLRFYRYILEHAPICLVPGGMLAMEIGDGMIAGIESLLGESSAWKMESLDDYTKMVRHVLLTMNAQASVVK